MCSIALITHQHTSHPKMGGCCTVQMEASGLASRWPKCVKSSPLCIGANRREKALSPQPDMQRSPEAAQPHFYIRSTPRCQFGLPENQKILWTISDATHSRRRACGIVGRAASVPKLRARDSQAWSHPLGLLVFLTGWTCPRTTRGTWH